MPARLLFLDPHAAADAMTFAGRASRLAEDAVRLQAAGGTLAMTAAPLAPRGLLDSTPTVLALRALPVDPELECDIVVTASALSPSADDAAAIDLPESAQSAAWAGISPPRSGWTELPGITASTLAERAQWGIAAVAEGMPQNAGEDAVRAIRASVWGAPDAQMDDLPRGAAFAAFAMGFVAGEETARVLTSGPWTRLTLARGHVLVRGPVRSGLTAVRATGSPTAR
ncbi:hypothetical protein [Microbacterium sp. P03]|uniref:hypothetical protein n=1 Tax=Microbacterium sp. P03 TaxID=3366946 RepID=UPI003745B3F4